MNALLKALMLGYMNEAGDGTDGGAGGGAAADRGDDFTPTDDDGAAAAAAAAAAAKAEEDELENDKDGKKEELEDGQQPRDKDGKFAKKDDKGITIPKARFDEARAKAREREAALNARIAELERQTQQAAKEQDVSKLDTEITDLEEKYQKLLDEGKTAEAKDTMRQIRLKERQIVEAQVEHKSERARQLAVEQFKVDTLIEKLEVDFPVLNPDADEYDQDTVDEVMLLRSGFEKNGMPSSQAIAKAVKYVLGTAKKTEAEPEGKKGLKAGEDRKSEQLKKNVEASKKQPPKVDAGLDSDKKGGGIDAKKATEYTEEEFAALPASTKARLRGDFFDSEAA